MKKKSWFSWYLNGKQITFYVIKDASAQLVRIFFAFERNFSVMSPSAYTVRYAVLILFYLFMNFVLFIIVKDNDMRFFIPKINNTKLKYVNKSEYKKSDSLSHKSMVKFNFQFSIWYLGFIFQFQVVMLLCF